MPVLYGTSKTAALRSLHELGYRDDLFAQDWSPRELVSDRAEDFYVSTVAFWGRPFDQFRSAVSIVERNGQTDYETARLVASKAWTHVVVCGDLDTSLWLFEANDVKKVAENVAPEAVSRVFREQERRLSRVNVARQKMRLRQYALYETDPSGAAYGEWAIRPSAVQASAVLSRLVSSIAMSEAMTSKPGEDPKYRRDTLVRLIFRVLSLRVGIDRGWPITQGLGPQDVSEMFQRASDYPDSIDYHSAGVSPAQAESLTDSVLDALRFYDFSTIDPILIMRAFSSPSLRELRAGLELFPTSRPIAWDIVSSIPLSSDQQVCDPTGGTGTFLVAAGLSLAASLQPDDDVAGLLRTMLVGGDRSDLAADLMRLALDLVFGWHERQWKIRGQSSEATLASLDRSKEWVILGNLPWSGSGRAENESSRILRTYLETMKQCPSGWIGAITPKSVWTKRDKYGDAIRAYLETDYRMEEIWELNWEGITGGRSQALATVMGRKGTEGGITVWKRQDITGGFKSIGYLRGKIDAEGRLGVRSPDAVYFAERFKSFRTLDSLFRVLHGLQPKSAEGLKRYRGEIGGAIRFVRNQRDFAGKTDESDNVWLPEWVIDNDEAVLQLFHRPRHEYRAAYKKVPQVVLTRNIYEGVSRLKVGVVDQHTLFSDSFFVCVPKSEGIARAVVSGMAVILDSAFGRIWLFLNAWAGRHISGVGLKQFPLPDDSLLSGFGANYSLDGEETSISSPHNLDLEIRICSAFGLNSRETAVILGIGAMLGLVPRLPASLLPSEDPRPKIHKLSEELSELLRNGVEGLTPVQRERASDLWTESLRANVEETRIVLESPSAVVSIEKSAIVETS